jgi:hypothetical protein
VLCRSCFQKQQQVKAASPVPPPATTAV